MQDGFWGFSESLICIDTEGHLMNGQHRMWAIINSGKPQMFGVAHNVPKSAMMHMDTGAPRTVANVLELAGHEQAARLAALCRVIRTFEENANFRLGQAVLTGQEAEELIVKRYGADVLQEAIAASTPFYKKWGFSSGVWAFLWIHFGDISPEDRDYFFSHLLEGAELESDNPIYVLREQLFKPPHVIHQGDRFNHVAAWIVKGWNAYRMGRKIGRIRFATGEDFPLAV